MVDVSIGNETSPEANWNRQTDRQADGRTDKPVYWEAAPPKIKCQGQKKSIHSQPVLKNIKSIQIERL